MTPSHPYTYVLLRYRHDPLAGEFVNVGIVLHAPKLAFLGVKARHTIGRLSKVFPDIDNTEFRSSLRSLEKALKRIAAHQAGDLLASSLDAGIFARRALPNDDSSLLWGPVGSGLTNDPADTLERLYQRFVARYDETPLHHRDDAAVWKPVHDRLAERSLGDMLSAKTIESPHDSVEFPYAWKNGAWHCYQPLSFDLANEDTIREKARRWAGHMVALSTATESFRPYFLVGSPCNAALAPAYRSAMEILKLSPGDVRVFEEARIDEFVDQIEEEIRSHSGSGRLSG